MFWWHWHKKVPPHERDLNLWDTLDVGVFSGHERGGRAAVDKSTVLQSDQNSGSTELIPTITSQKKCLVCQQKLVWYFLSQIADTAIPVDWHKTVPKTLGAWQLIKRFGEANGLSMVGHTTRKNNKQTKSIYSNYVYIVSICMSMWHVFQCLEYVGPNNQFNWLICDRFSTLLKCAWTFGYVPNMHAYSRPNFFCRPWFQAIVSLATKKTEV